MSTQVGVAQIDISANLEPFNRALEALKETIQNFTAQINLQPNKEAVDKALQELRELGSEITLDIKTDDKSIERSTAAISTQTVALQSAAVAGVVVASSFTAMAPPLKSASALIEGMGAILRKVEDGIRLMGSEINSSSGEVQALENQLKQHQQTLNSMVKEYNTLADDVGASTESLKGFNDAIVKQSNVVSSLEAEIDRLSATEEESIQKRYQVIDACDRVNAAYYKMQDATKTAQQATDKFNQSFSRIPIISSLVSKALAPFKVLMAGISAATKQFAVAILLLKNAKITLIPVVGKVAKTLRLVKVTMVAIKVMALALATAVKALVAAFGAVAIAVGVFLVKASGAADAIDNLANQTGLSIASVQSLTKVATDAGLAFSDLQGVIGRLVGQQDQALAGNEKAIQSYAALGITLADLRRLSPEQLLDRVSASLARGAGNANVNAASLELLGRNSVKLRRTLEELGRVSLDGLNKSMDEAGRTVSTDNILILDKFNQTWTITRDKIKTATLDIAANILVMVQVAKAAIKGLIDFIPGLAFAFKSIGVGAEAIFENFKKGFDFLFGSIPKIREILDQGDVLFRARWDEQAAEAVRREAIAAAEEAAIAVREAEEFAAREAQREDLRERLANYKLLEESQEAFTNAVRGAVEARQRDNSLLVSAVALEKEKLQAAQDQVVAYEAQQAALRASLSLISGAASIQAAFQQNAFRQIDPKVDFRLGQANTGDMTAELEASTRLAEESLRLNEEAIRQRQEQLNQSERQLDELKNIRTNLLRPVVI